MKKIIITILVTTLPMFSQILQTVELQNHNASDYESLLKEQIEKVEQLQFNVDELIDSVVINGGKGTHSYLYDNENRVTDYTFNNSKDTVKTKYYRDSNGYLTKILSENNTSWNTYKLLFYDEDNKIKSIVDSSYSQVSRINYQYNSDGSLFGSYLKRYINNAGEGSPDWLIRYENNTIFTYVNNLISSVDIRSLTIGQTDRPRHQKKYYYYDDDLRLESYIFLDNHGFAMFEETATKYYYDTEGLIELETIENFHREIPENIKRSKKVYNYYADNNLQDVTTFKFNTVDSSYVTQERTSYKYDSFNNKTIILVEIFDNEWENRELTEYSYDENGKCILGENFWWLNEFWKPRSKSIGFTDSNGENHMYHCSEFQVYYRDSKIVNYKLGIESGLDTTIHYLTSGSMNEGSSYYLDSLKLPEPLNNYERQINVFQGTRFSLDHGATNENISLDIRFMGITPNGITNPIDNTPLFMFLGIEVTGENSGVTSFEDFYYLSEGKKARICIPMTDRFFEMMNELDIDTSEINFAYVKGGEYFTEGLEWEIKQGEESKPDSLCVYLDHFSKIVGGKNFVTSIEDEVNQLPTLFRLEQNYPNPFNPETTIRYSIPSTFIPSGVEGRLVELKIYDVLGREVKSLVSRYQNPGNYEVMFNASNLASGIYYYQLKTGSYVETKKMILMK